MSSAARQPEYAGLKLTAERYASLGETEQRYELVNGVVMMSPSPKPLHWEIVQEILSQIRAACPKARTFSEIDVFFDQHHVYRPDLSVYAPGRLPRNPRRLDAPPDLIVEVVSPGGRPLDLVTKRDDYDRFGVGEYWVVDPDEDRVRVFQRQGGGPFVGRDAGDRVACGALPTLELNVSRVVSLWRDQHEQDGVG